jgi:hypothetical protein
MVEVDLDGREEVELELFKCLLSGAEDIQGDGEGL